MIELRPYQVEAIDGARELFRGGMRKALLIAPTGAGKTVMFCDVISRAVAKGSRAIVLAHRRELVAQTSQKLHAFGVPHGIIQAGFASAPQRPVQVASVQTLLRRPGIVSSADLIVIDEAHHVTDGNTYATLLSWFPQALLLGVTATPWRLDGRGLGDVFEGHVIARTPRQLRDEGFLVPVGGWEYEAIDTAHARVERGDFVAKDMIVSATSRKVVGDIVAEWKEHAAGKRTVLFAITVAHSQAMAAAFRAAGVPAEHLDGETPMAERDAILARLRSGQTLLVCNCNVLTEGFDCPELEVAILARPTLSTALCLQMVGRILRPAPGKVLARIHDHAGCLRAHGHPYAQRDYSPENSAKKNRKATERSGLRPVLCKQCNSFLVGGRCDACGYQLEAPALDVEFQEAAVRRAISEDYAGKKKPAESDGDRMRRWKDRWADDEAWKRGFYARMVEKHGAGKAPRVYWWFTGKSEWPRPEWAQAEARLA